MPQLRVYASFGILVFLGVGTGCWRRPTQLKADMFVGEYVFQMGDSGAPYHDPDRLILRANGTYTLIHMPGGHPGWTEGGSWEVYNNQGETELAFGNRGCLIRTKGKRIRLIVNDDLDYYYEKTK